MRYIMIYITRYIMRYAYTFTNDWRVEIVDGGGGDVYSTLFYSVPNTDKTCLFGGTFLVLVLIPIHTKIR